MIMATSGSAVLGLSVSGELRGGRIEEGRPRPSGDGAYPDRYVLSVGAGDDVFRVEFRDEEAARAAVGESAAKGDLVTIPVGVRAAKGYIFYFGRGASASVDDLTW